ncbi:hypothetical protein [Chryseobacterium sp. POE27]
MRKIIVVLIVLFISVSNLTAQNIKTELDQYFSALAENKQFNGNV